MLVAKVSGSGSCVVVAGAIAEEVLLPIQGVVFKTSLNCSVSPIRMHQKRRRISRLSVRMLRG